jgi:hypothetical protein
LNLEFVLIPVNYECFADNAAGCPLFMTRGCLYIAAAAEAAELDTGCRKIFFYTLEAFQLLVVDVELF